MSDLPTGWRRGVLGDVVSLVRNGIFARRPTDDPDGVPILRISAVRSGRLEMAARRYVAGLDAETTSKFAIHPGDLLFTRYNGSRDLVGRCARVPEHDGLVIHPDKLIRVVPRNDVVDSRFLALLAESQSVRRFLEPRIKTTAGQSGVTGKDIRSIPIAYPSMSEQRRIVDTLEDHLSRLEAAAATLTQTERRLGTLRRSSLAAVINDTARKAVPLGRLIERIEAGRSFGGANAPASATEWGIIKVSAMTWGEFRPQENKSVPAGAVNPSYEIRPGDLLLSRANTSDYVGASVLVGEVRPRLLLSDKSLRLVPKDGVDRRWLWLVLSSPGVRAQISAAATGTKDSMRNISQSGLLSIQIPDVSFADQRADVARLTASLQAVTQLSELLKPTQLRQRSLRQSLLDAAFAGRLAGNLLDIEVVEEMAGV